MKKQKFMANHIDPQWCVIYPNHNYGTALRKGIYGHLGMSFLAHYENLPMQYNEICLALKIENFQLKIFDIFLIFAQNIDCGYTLEPPRRL